MIWILRSIVPAVWLFVTFSPAHGQSYGEELNLGVAAYRDSHYEEAIQHFKKATELDSSKPIAHLYLATAYVNQYIPGVESDDNKLLAQQAIEQYQIVLNSEAVGDSRINSAKGIAYLYLNMKNWDDARKYYQMASDLSPNDAEPPYSMGVIDWTQCYQRRMEARARLEMRPDEHLSSKKPEQKKVCDELQAKNWSIIEDGISKFDKAIHLRPNYDDAMAYMNLMYRERADLECDDLAARSRDLQTADDWVDKALAAKKVKAEKANGPK